MEKNKRLTPSFWMFWILAIGFAVRSWHLEIKPVHFDEGINGHFVDSIWRDGFYHYDPTNFHGPLYFYILMLAERLFGFGIFGYRFMTGLIQMALLFIVGLHRRFVGTIAIWAALIMALSPAFVFYSRYAIHESLFTLSEIAFSYGYFLYREEKSNKSLWWMALAIVGLVTTKETFFIFLGTWAIAVAAVKAFEFTFPKWRAAPDAGASIPAPRAQNWIAISLVAAILILALFTGFFLYPKGAVDMVTALAVWTHTGTAHTGHEKPFFYWLDLLRRFEWPCLIGLALTPVLFFFSARPMRIVLLVGFGSWLAYSLIPYKTPWLSLSFLWPLAFAGGAIIHRVLPPFPWWRGVRTGLAVGCLASIFFSGAEMIRLNFKDFAKRDEPYVYVQSTEELKKVVDVIFLHLKANPEDVSLKVLALNRDPWPLPYLLNPLSNVTWSQASVTDFTNASVVLSDMDDMKLIESKLGGQFFKVPFQIRDAYESGWAYFSIEKFKADFPTGTLVITGAVKP